MFDKESGEKLPSYCKSKSISLSSGFVIGMIYISIKITRISNYGITNDGELCNYYQGHISHSYRWNTRYSSARKTIRGLVAGMISDCLLHDQIALYFPENYPVIWQGIYINLWKL